MVSRAPPPDAHSTSVLAKAVKVLLWRLLAIAAFALAIVGALLPVLPTVPFLLVSAWAASHGWPAFETWLLTHPRFGPTVQRWRERGAISRPAKWLASSMMLTSALLLQWFDGIPPWLRLGVPALMLGMAVWLWRRPER